jgi:hypothetical protein
VLNVLREFLEDGISDKWLDIFFMSKDLSCIYLIYLAEDDEN